MMPLSNVLRHDLMPKTLGVVDERGGGSLCSQIYSPFG